MFDIDSGARDWNELGELDPLWAVLTESSKRNRGWEEDEFFRTGEEEIALVLATAAEWSLPRNRERGLDFGCGVGRLTQAIARRFSETIGVDISEAMLARASKLNAHVPNCRFHLNRQPDLSRYESNSFDFVYTNKVLQHLKQKQAIRLLITEFVRVLKPGGLAVFQVPAYIPPRRRIQPRRRVYHLLRQLGVSSRSLYTTFGLNPMRMTYMPDCEVREVIRAAGGTLVHVRSDSEAGPGIDSRTWFVTR
jgi:SAM-dependent methyltransferase